MKRFIVSERKNISPFRKTDIIFYALLVLLVFSLFLCVFLTKDDSEKTGWTVYLGENAIAEYSYTSDAFTVRENFSDKIEYLEDGSGFYFTVFTDGKSDPAGFNEFYYSRLEKTLKVLSSDCAGHDCERQSVTDKGGFILCVPHGVKVVCNGFTNPVAG